ncbi:hypothetical protein Hs30E_18730 [Lactococcus hodotermopsidis]|uniref:VanZ-like domain-containing protein n=1 Tax=Pseudolactococcus hodotermopsidis TaxID=2709157 RepID=A0A6A0BD36_9LACT|nr:VanZ family protein [Lactococcus hodotermopsidis]GFH43322.1 hypothetical protein Hs30E_18730 [Lactococcus hodotermopsidis]
MKKSLKLFIVCYILAIVGMCFLPQTFYPQLNSIETPGIQHFGRITAILTPFNTLVHFGKIPSLWDVFVVILQNITNIFLLFPLVLAILLLRRNAVKLSKVVLMTFCMSLSIELTQVILDLLFEFDRVFEIDDLMTNTLGGVIAYQTYRILRK